MNPAVALWLVMVNAHAVIAWYTVVAIVDVPTREGYRIWYGDLMHPSKVPRTI